MRSNAPFLRPTAFPPPSPPPMLPGFVRGFLGTMQSSDSSYLPAGLRSFELPRLARDRVAAAGGMRPPRFRTKDVSTCMGSQTARGPARARRSAQDDVDFSSAERDRHLGIASFAAQYPAHGLPCERFTSALADCREAFIRLVFRSKADIDQNESMSRYARMPMALGGRVFSIIKRSRGVVTRRLMVILVPLQ